jgi:putative exporter of polyketide antibiotics
LGLRNTFWFGLRSALPTTLIWGLPISLYLGLSIFALDGIRGELTGLLKSEIYRSQGFLALPTDANLLSLSLSLILVVFTAYAVVQVVGWNNEESEGRLELILSTSQPRWQLLVTRYLVNLIASALTCGLVGLIISPIALFLGVKLDFSYILASFFGLWVVCAVIMAVGFAFSAFKPGQSIAIISGGLVVFFFVDSLGGLLKLPDWFINLSVYHAFGKPLLFGIDWTPQLVMLGLSGVFVAVAVYFFRQRDIVK